MAERKMSSWDVGTALAAAVLRDRSARRRIMAKTLVLAVGLVAAGLWLLNDWLMAGVWQFLIWWGGCAVVTGFMMMLALYDALAVIREERDQARRDRDD